MSLDPRTVIVDHEILAFQKQIVDFDVQLMPGATRILSAPSLVQATAMWSATIPAGIRSQLPADIGLPFYC